MKADVTIEASGSRKAMGMTPWITAMGGAIVQLGMQETASDFPFFQTWIREQTIIPSAAYDIDFPIAVDLLARGKVRVDPMITSRIGLDAIIDQGYEELLGPNRTSHIKILVSP